MNISTYLKDGRLVQHRIDSSSRRAFTLPELLVVLGIIVVLIAILLPAVAGARRTARATLCMGRLRMVGALTHSYAVMWEFRLPVNSFGLRDDPAALVPSLPPGTAGTDRAQRTGEGSTSNRQWLDAVAAAAGWEGRRTIAGRYAAGQQDQFRDTTQFLWCPDVDQSVRDPAVFATSYGMPRQVALKFQKKAMQSPAGATMNDFNAVDYYRLDRVRDSTLIVFLAEYNFRDDSSGPYNIRNDNLANVQGHDAFPIKPAVQHRGLNYLFFDGHVERLPAPPHPMHNIDGGEFRTSDDNRYMISVAQITTFSKLLAKQ